MDTNLETGKLYSISSTYRFSEEIQPPLEAFVYGTASPHRDTEDTGVSIPNGTCVIYLGNYELEMHYPAPWQDEIYTYFKLLVDDHVLYVLDDGWCHLERVDEPAI